MGVEPARIKLAAQPGQLALGQLAGGEDGPVAEAGRIALPVQVFPGLAVAFSPQGGIQALGLKEDGVGYAMDDNNKSLVTPEMQAAVEKAKAPVAGQR